MGTSRQSSLQEAAASAECFSRLKPTVFKFGSETVVLWVQNKIEAKFINLILKFNNLSIKLELTFWSWTAACITRL